MANRDGEEADWVIKWMVNEVLGDNLKLSMNINDQLILFYVQMALISYLVN